MGRVIAGQRRVSEFLLDTSFLITLVNPERDFHDTAKRYYRTALERGVPMYLSAIVASEFQVRQPVASLPQHNFIVLPFNIDHAVTAGRLFAELLQSVRDWQGQRSVVKDDVKLIAQADCGEIPYLLTADEQTLCRYARRLAEAGQVRTRPVVLSQGFDAAWFEGGQGTLLGG